MGICLTLKAFITTVVLILAQTVEVNAATANRTWVSGKGIDTAVNTCNRSNPCLTFAYALGQTNAGGEIDAVDPGDFGTLTTPNNITKSITIDGTGTLAGITDISGTAITVAAGTSDVVVIRNITFNGINFLGNTGIDFQSGGQLVIEDCKFIGFGTAIQMSSATNPTNLVIKNSTITNCGNGVSIKSTVLSTSSIVLDNVSISKTNVGVLAASGKIDIWNCFITQTDTGIDGENCIINCLNSLLTANTTSAINARGGATVFISNNDFYDNLIGFILSGSKSTIETANNNRISNNGSSSFNGAPNSSITIQ